jgi:hypothetical protein
MRCSRMSRSSRPAPRLRSRPLAALAGLVALAALAGVGAREAAAQASALPFAPGERITYAVKVARVRGSGRSTMWIEGPTNVRGSEAWLLRFDFSARVGPIGAEDRTSSWLDARRLTSLRYVKRERHPLSRHDDEVELFPESRAWRAKDGTTGASPTDEPLDELSFMYFLRTLPLDGAHDWRFDRHYAADRNPTLVRVVKREDIVTAAGTFRTVQLEMRVKDPRRYKGDGVIRINLSDDACRIPVRIESQMPVVGAAVMLLESHNLKGCTASPDTTLAAGK